MGEVEEAYHLWRGFGLVMVMVNVGWSRERAGWVVMVCKF